MRPNHLLTHGYTPTCDDITDAIAGALQPADGAAESGVIRLLDLLDVLSAYQSAV